MAENSHTGHRKRLRQELTQQDFHESIPDYKILEALLFYGIPQKDTNQLAHLLINTFGSLGAVLEADAYDLFQVKGMTERAVTLIKMILPLSRRYHSEKYKVKHQFRSVEEIGDFLKAKHFGYNKEVFMVTTFTDEGCMIACDIINKGDANSVSLSVKAVVQAVLKHNAPCVIISHNHISKSALPSKNDIQTTKTLFYTLKQMNIRLLDHIIISENDYVSMAQSEEHRSLFIINQS